MEEPSRKTIVEDVAEEIADKDGGAGEGDDEEEREDLGIEDELDDVGSEEDLEERGMRTTVAPEFAPGLDDDGEDDDEYDEGEKEDGNDDDDDEVRVSAELDAMEAEEEE